MAIKEIKLLNELDTTKQLTFAYLTCERLFPNYVYFSKNYDFGNPHVLREAADYLYKNIFTTSYDENKINGLIKRIEANTPDPGEFDTILASSALDACSVLYYSLLFFINKDFSNISYISTVAKDSVDMYIREIENIEASDENYVQKVTDHPFMQKELSVQSGIIAFLLNRTVIDFDDIHTLLQLQDNNEKGNLGL